MNKVAIAFSTKDRVELTQQTIEPLIRPEQFDLWWIDGSATSEGANLPLQYPTYIHVHGNVRGGADAAIVYSLTTLLNAPEQYDYIGLVENDVLLTAGWFEAAMNLFELGAADGLRVGAVSARCFEDRILCQRDDYALMHNLGAGMVIFTREAAKIALHQFRTTYTLENRKVFAQLAGIDIGRYWAFQGGEQWLCADWGIDKNLAAAGYASLATSVSHVEMIGQDPPLAQQGLTLTKGPVAARKNNKAFAEYRARHIAIRDGFHVIAGVGRHQDTSGTWIIFPHELPSMGGIYDKGWQLQWIQGFGPFSYRAREAGAEINIPVFGSCGVIVGGGALGGRMEITDTHSGFKAAPHLPPSHKGYVSNLTVEVPTGLTYRIVTIRALEPGPVFYGLACREAQPFYSSYEFDHSALPGV